MLVSICFILIYRLISSVTAIDSDVSIICDSCKEKKGAQLEGTVGSDLKLTYTVTTIDFQILTIKYNESKNIIDIAPNKINIKYVKDRRFSFSKLFIGTNHQSVTITLRNLTLDDNGLAFKHEYKDKELETWTGVKTLKVKASIMSDKAVGDGNEISLTFTNLIIICAVAIIVLIAVITLLLLCRKGIPSRSTCCSAHRRDDGPNEDIQMENIHEPIYATPSNALARPILETEYAELGPGGGRIDKPDFKPTQSLYAQVKTEDVNYPSLDTIQYSEYTEIGNYTR